MYILWISIPETKDGRRKIWSWKYCIFSGITFEKHAARLRVFVIIIPNYLYLSQLLEAAKLDHIRTLAQYTASSRSCGTDMTVKPGKHALSLLSQVITPTPL